MLRNFYKFENILPGMRRKVNISTLMVFHNQRRRRWLWMNRKMIGEAIYIRVSDRKMKSDSHKTWKCADQALERQIRRFIYVEL